MSDQNIRVCVRFRPVNKVEVASKEHKLVVHVAKDHKSVTIGSSSKKSKTFQFDYIFPTGSTQEDVFLYSALPLVDNIMAGYNCTLFAYGQTGSGKTYTMEGLIHPNQQQDRADEGLIPRMVRTIFDRVETDSSNAEFEFSIRVSFVEIYNEKLRDLLQPNGPQLKVREKTGGASGVYIEGVYAPFVASPEEVFAHLQNGHINRHVASTRMNETSSRSHAVFMLELNAKNQETGSTKASKLMMVDLAGSEKVRKTGATGQTMKEAQQINKSLMVLGLVINSLVENRKHTPYRDSKLTRLLSDALGGNSKTMLIVTGSPSKYNMEETITSCRFGQRAKAIKNVAKINQELSVNEYKKLLEKTMLKEEALKTRVQMLQTQCDVLTQACNDNNIDVEALMKATVSAASADNKGHAAVNNTQALVTIVPKSNADAPENIATIETLQSKLEQVSDAKAKVDETLASKELELKDAEKELSESRQDMEKFELEFNTMREKLAELAQEKTHTAQILDSVKSAQTVHEASYAQEVKQWHEDKTQLQSEIDAKDKSIFEQQILIQQLRDAAPSTPSSPSVGDFDANKLGQYSAKTKVLVQKYQFVEAEKTKFQNEAKKLEKRDKMNKQLQENLRIQLKQMESALMIANDQYIQQREQYAAAMQAKENEVMNMKKLMSMLTTRFMAGASSSKTQLVAQSQSPTAVTMSLRQSTTVHPGQEIPMIRKSRIVKPKVLKGAVRISHAVNANLHAITVDDTKQDE